jgi:hypothetical protein
MITLSARGPAAVLNETAMAIGSRSGSEQAIAVKEGGGTGCPQQGVADRGGQPDRAAQGLALPDG